MHNVFGKSGVTMLSGGAVAKSVPVALVVEFQISVTSDFVGELKSITLVSAVLLIIVL